MFTQPPSFAVTPIVPMEHRDAMTVGRLYADTFPQAVFAKLGQRFAARFHRWIQQQPDSEVWVARDPNGNVVGMIAGTLDRPTIYRTIVRQHLLAITFSVLASLYKPSVVAWIVRAFWQRLRPPAARSRTAPRPPAELLAIVVANEAKGTGLAHRLVEHMETEFRVWGFEGTYKIVTLSTNARANAFYCRIGATLGAQVPAQQFLVNEYHKSLSASHA